MNEDKFAQIEKKLQNDLQKLGVKVSIDDLDMDGEIIYGKKFKIPHHCGRYRK